MTVREVIKLIEADGWYLDRQRSSHRQFKHPTKPGLVTVAGHPPKVLAPKTLGASSGRRGWCHEVPDHPRTDADWLLHLLARPGGVRGRGR